MFAGLGSLTQLWLYNNRLTALPPGVFAGLGSLEDLRLELYNNRLTALPPGVFAGLGSLVNLRLYDNRLTALPPGVFDGLGSLTELWLQWEPSHGAAAGRVRRSRVTESLWLNGNASRRCRRACSRR